MLVDTNKPIVRLYFKMDGVIRLFIFSVY